MKKILMILALSLPLMAQEAEAKESVGKKVVRTIQDAEWSKSKSAHQRDHNKNGDMKRGGMKRGDMNRRMAMAKRKKMQKKRFWRSAVRVVVIGGVAYYIGYTRGERSHKGGWDKKPPMGDRK
ncbi:hypothetical protein HOE22_05935 [Candidatus Woesearchaeota archaeon]|nr:hypothetical protein [Candidatus Woesearchaeota archaeon]